MGRPKGSKNKPKVVQPVSVANESSPPVKVTTYREEAEGTVRTGTRYEVGEIKTTKPIQLIQELVPARALRSGDSLLTVDGRSVRTEWQQVVSVREGSILGIPHVLVSCAGDILHKIHPDIKCGIGPRLTR